MDEQVDDQFDLWRKTAKHITRDSDRSIGLEVVEAMELLSQTLQALYTDIGAARASATTPGGKAIAGWGARAALFNLTDAVHVDGQVIEDPWGTGPGQIQIRVVHVEDFKRGLRVEWGSGQTGITDRSVAYIQGASAGLELADQVPGSGLLTVNVDQVPQDLKAIWDSIWGTAHAEYAKYIQKVDKWLVFGARFWRENGKLKEIILDAVDLDTDLVGGEVQAAVDETRYAELTPYQIYKQLEGWRNWQTYGVTLGIEVTQIAWGIKVASMVDNIDTLWSKRREKIAEWMPMVLKRVHYFVYELKQARLFEQEDILIDRICKRLAKMVIHAALVSDPAIKPEVYASNIARTFGGKAGGAEASATVDAALRRAHRLAKLER